MVSMRYKPKDFLGQRALFIRAFMEDLERPYISFLTTQLSQVVGKNEAITGAPCYYLGDTVYARGLTVAKIGKYKLGGMATLDHSLQGLHDEWREHYEEHKASWERFNQSLRVIMMAGESWQDLRDMFPDHVLQPYMHTGYLQGLTRTRPSLQDALPRPSILPQPRPQDQYLCAWLPEEVWNPHLVLQYGAITTKVDLYVGYRLL